IDVGLTAAGDREGMSGMIVSGNFFEVLRVRPEIGRFFSASEDRTPLAAPLAVISHRMWTDRFKSARDVIGRKILVQNVPFTIIGVTPEGFIGPYAFVQHDVYVPLAMAPAVRKGDPKLLDSWSSGWLTVIGRLRPDVSRALAAAELSTLADASRQRAADADPIAVRVRQMRPIPVNG